MIDVLTIGEILMDLVATQTDVTLFDAPAFQPNPGGAPANVAVGVARLGRTAAFIGKVGADEFGAGLRALLEREGVVTRGLFTDPDAMTTLAFVALSASGDPHFAFAPGAHTHLTAADLPLDLIRDARMVYAGSVSLANEPVGAATLAALALARQAGAFIAYDVNWRPTLYRHLPLTTALDIVRQPLRHANLVKLNAGELRLLTGSEDIPAGLDHLRAWTDAELIVVTLGERGSAAWFANQLIEVPAPPVERVVDATGAGDAFLAALLVALSDNPRDLDAHGVRAALRRAGVAGAITVTRHGAIPALPTAANLDAMLREQDQG